MLSKCESLQLKQSSAYNSRFALCALLRSGLQAAI